MAESMYERINDFGAVKIMPASPNDVRSCPYRRTPLQSCQGQVRCL